MFSLLPPQKRMLVGVKNTALRNVLFLVYACIQKPDNTLREMAFQTNLTPTSIHCSHNQSIFSVFLQGLAVPVSWAVQLEFLALAEVTGYLPLCYSRVHPATFCKRT